MQATPACVQTRRPCRCKTGSVLRNILNTLFSHVSHCRLLCFNNIAGIALRCASHELSRTSDEVSHFHSLASHGRDAATRYSSGMDLANIGMQEHKQKARHQVV